MKIFFDIRKYPIFGWLFNVIFGLQPFITAKCPENFVGIIQLLCNPDGYTLCVTLGVHFLEFLMENQINFKIFHNNASVAVVLVVFFLDG